ncbi:MAG: hypothetical protein H6828_00175 [Planctomycetes bacterium]|nr:hypothetical protein [Planctomycetota bacterium]
MSGGEHEPRARRGTQWVQPVIGAALVGLVLTACDGGTGQSPLPVVHFAGFSVGDEVARLELAAPDVDSFVLHGTLPLPPAMHQPGASQSPFVVRDPEGHEVPAQVETVTRYAAAEDGADVVEVLARVARPAAAAPGDRLTYTVLWAPHAPDAPSVDADVQALLDDAGALVLRTHDVFGHTYEADLLTDLRANDPLELRRLRSGPVADQWRTHENLVPVTPVAGSTGTLPHLMGVHTYVTTWRDEGFVTLELRVHNGHEGEDPDSDQDDPLDKLYFEDLELAVPSGWTLLELYPTPSTGTSYLDGGATVYPLVAPIGGGLMHMMPRQAMFHRRLALCRVGEEARAQAALEEQGLAFCTAGQNGLGQELLSWWNGYSARYYPQNVRLPHLDYIAPAATMRTQLANEFADIRAAHQAGTTGPWPMVTPELGWAHPWGPNVGNMHGGAEINFWDGVKTAWSGSREGYLGFQLRHRMVMDRHPTAFYDRHGREHQLEDWLAEGPNGTYLPIYMWIVPWLPLADPHGFTSSPSFQRDAVVAQNRQPAYDAQLAGFQNIDNQHWVRATRAAKVLTWLGNDALAKDDLRLQGELARSSYQFYEQDVWGYAIVTGALHDKRYVDAHPGQGFEVDRGEGWLLDTVATAYALQDEDWRGRARPWLEEVIDMFHDGASHCSGAIMSVPNTAHFGGQYRILQSISEAILQNALWGLKSTVFEGRSAQYVARLDELVADSARAMVNPLVWDEGVNAPAFYTALGPYDATQAAYCGYLPPDGQEGTDNVQTWSLFAFGYRLTGDSNFLNRAAQMANGPLTPAGIGMDVHDGELENRVAILSLLQEL